MLALEHLRVGSLGLALDTTVPSCNNAQNRRARWLHFGDSGCNETGELHYALSSNSTAEKECHISAWAVQAHRQGL